MSSSTLVLGKVKSAMTCHLLNFGMTQHFNLNFRWYGEISTFLNFHSEKIRKPHNVD